MNPLPPASVTPRQLVGLIWFHRSTWLVPAVICAAIAAAYSLVAPRYWEASQALVVRQETAGTNALRPGKFADLYEMRTLQETILELAKSQQVVVATLHAVDSRMLGREPAPPSLAQIEKFRHHLKMLPPDGSEFGKTEVFYFCVSDPDRERAIELVGELCLQLDKGLRDLRAKRAGSLIAELQEQVTIAGRQHAAETDRLEAFESQVGSDLGELRMLHSGSSGQSDLRMEVVQVETDSRNFKTQVREAEQLVALLQAAQKDPLTLIATPNSLLASQPALRRLKDGLVDAQLATARLAGTRSSDHPLVRAAVEAEKQIREDLHRELNTAIDGAQVELNLGRQRLGAAQERLDNLQGRLTRLAENRAEYSNRIAGIDNSRISLDRARADLSLAKAALAAAHSGSLVTRLDKPETGPHPIGPGRKVIVGAGGVVGLALGLGFLFLFGGPRTNDRRQAGDRRSVPRPAASASQPPVAAGTTQSPAAAALPPVVSEPAAASVNAVAPQPVTAAAPQWDDGWFSPLNEAVATGAVRVTPLAAQASAKSASAEGGAKKLTLPPLAPPAGEFSGMSLQEALQAAQRLQS